MKKNIPPKRKIKAIHPRGPKNPHSLTNLKQAKIQFPDGKYLKVEEFLKRIKADPGFYDKETLLARAILFEVCRYGDQDNAKAARIILESAGYTEETIPKESRAKRRTPDPILFGIQRHPKDFLVATDSDIEQIKSLVRHRLKQKEIEEDIKEVFKNLYGRDLTQEEMEKVRKRIGPKKKPWSFPELAIQFFTFDVNSKRRRGGQLFSFNSALELYFKEKKKAKHRAFNDIWGITEEARKILDRKYRRFFGGRLGLLKLK